MFTLKGLFHGGPLYSAVLNAGLNDPNAIHIINQSDLIYVMIENISILHHRTRQPKEDTICLSSGMGSYRQYFSWF